MKQLALLIAFIVACFQSVTAQSIAMDSTLSDDGVVLTKIGTFDFYHRSMVVQQDGKVLIAGQQTMTQKKIIGRFNTDGQADTSFHFPDISPIPFYPTVIALQKNEQILTASGPSLFRFNRDGTLDETFGVNGTAPTLGVRFTEIVRGSDEKIIAAGYQSVGGSGEAPVGANLMVYLPNGALDNSFSDDGLFSYHPGETQYFFNVAVQSDGKIVAAGTASTPNGFKAIMLRINPDGQLDTTFGVQGEVIYQISGYTESYGIALQPDGKILLSGYTFNPYRATVIRFMPDGSFDTSFGENGICSIPALSEGVDLLVLPDGKILVYGWLSTSNNKDKSALIQVLPNGTLDPDFGDNGVFFSPLENARLQMSLAQTASNKFVGICHAAEGYVLQRFITSLQVGTLAPESVGADNLLLYPNPIAAQCKLQFSLKQPETVDFRLFDLNGQLLSNLSVCNRFTAGEHEVDLRLDENLPAGHYVLALFVSGKRTTSVQITKT